MHISSMPAGVTAAGRKDLKPNVGRQPLDSAKVLSDGVVKVFDQAVLSACVSQSDRSANPATEPPGQSLLRQT
jgi:hypothetical protein